MRRLTDVIIKSALKQAEDKKEIENISDDCILGYEVEEHNKVLGLFPSEDKDKYILEIGLKPDNTIICHKEVICVEQVRDTLEIFNMNLAKYFE